jgi:hypothetical protein
MARRRTSRRRDRRQESSSANIWLGVFVVAAIGVIAAAAYFSTSIDRINGGTGCISGKPHTAHTVFLLDRSDDFSGRQIEDLRQALIQTYEELEINELFSIYAIGGQVPSIPRPVASFCQPPLTSWQGNPWATDEFLQDRYDEIFEQNVSPILRDLTTPLSSDESPLLEWIVSISETTSFSSERLSDRRMVMFSDMVQYVPQEDFAPCGRFPAFNDFRDDRYYERIATDLSNVRITVFNVRRANGDGCTVASQRNMRALEDFWFDYFDDAGAYMSPRRFTRIGE